MVNAHKVGPAVFASLWLTLGISTFGLCGRARANGSLIVDESVHQGRWALASRSEVQLSGFVERLKREHLAHDRMLIAPPRTRGEDFPDLVKLRVL